MIPGSTIKGILRAWLHEHRADDPGANASMAAAVDAVFGATKDDEPIRGGKAEFRDAELTAPAAPQLAGAEDHRRWWDPRRGTCVEPHVGIDPRTRTSDDKRFFYNEFVPEDSEFTLIVHGQRLSDNELLLLIRALEAFNEGARIGAECASEWGKLTWQLTSVQWTDKNNVVAWLNDPDKTLPFSDHPTAIPVLKSEAIASFPLGGGRQRCSMAVTLHFEGGFLVNDPSQVRDKKDVRGSLSFATVLRGNGKPYLPSASVRGAIRGQAARIWRTVASQLVFCNI